MVGAGDAAVFLRRLFLASHLMRLFDRQPLPMIPVILIGLLASRAAGENEIDCSGSESSKARIKFMVCRDLTISLGLRL